MLNTTTIIDILCNGSSTGLLEILNPDFFWLYLYWHVINGDTIWSDFDLQTALFAGDVYITCRVMNYSGCTTTDTVEISQLDAITTIPRYYRCRLFWDTLRVQF